MQLYGDLNSGPHVKNHNSPKHTRPLQELCHCQTKRTVYIMIAHRWALSTENSGGPGLPGKQLKSHSAHVFALQKVSSPQSFSIPYFIM